MERKYQKVSRWKEILVVVLSFGMIIGGALWRTARVEAAEKISNPRIEDGIRTKCYLGLCMVWQLSAE